MTSCCSSPTHTIWRQKIVKKRGQGNDNYYAERNEKDKHSSAANERMKKREMGGIFMTDKIKVIDISIMGGDLGGL